MGFFSDLFGTGGAAEEAAQAKIQGLRQAQAYAEPLYGQGRDVLSQGYGQAQDVFQPVYNIGLGGAGAYADITGAAGAAGQDRARALFQTDPGYEFARKEALRAVERQSGTGGGQYSGNVLAALQDRASGLAQQQYGNYVQRLAPFLGYSLGGAGGLAGLYAGEAGALEKNLLGQANLGYGTQAGIGSAQAGGILGEAQAEQAALGQALGLGSKLLGFALGGPAGGFGGGSTSLFGGAGPLFGGTNPNAWYTG
jgi:hypothetical protein